MMGAAERFYRACLLALPRAFRTEYGEAMVRAFGSWRADAPRGAARFAFWARVSADLVRSIAREWVDVVRGGTRGADRPPYGMAALAGLCVLLLYALTLAPTTGFWDAGEYITVAHILGIPHPPGNPLFVLAAHAWEWLLEPLGLPTAVDINLFSAVLSAAAHALWFLIVDRALAGWGGDRTARRIAAWSAVALSATAFTVWNQSNVNEKVYTISLFTTALITWLALRWRDGGRRVAPLVLIAFLVALTATNHLMGVLVVPALLVYVVQVEPRVLLRTRLWARALPLAAVALSVPLFLPLRAAQGPLVAEGDPRCPTVSGAVASTYSWGATGCETLNAVLRRVQYAKPPVWSDPTDPRLPRDGELVAAQVLNWAQYVDWQWARSLGGADPLFGGARPAIMLLVVILVALGARTHWRSDRRSAAYIGTLVLTLSLGLVFYLNFKYGYSIATDRYPAASMHEVRERDYFFVIGFSVLGLWAGIGLATVWRHVGGWLGDRVAQPRLVAAPLLGVALVPLALNWSWASRADDWTPRDWAYNVLMSVEPYGVLVTNGDNDSFPLWYLQEVEGLRRDVTVVLSPFLSSPWYLRQLRALTQPCAPGRSAQDAPTRIVCQRPFVAAELPAPLVQAGWTSAVRSPVDSIVPLSDNEIAQISTEWFVADRALPLRVGEIETAIPEGTLVEPSAVYLASILRATMGERSIHFMPGSPLVRALGLSDHVVRQGVLWRLDPVPGSDGDHIVALQGSPYDAPAIDLPLTDTLLNEVYITRGRILDANSPWVDPASVSIPLQYTYAHYAAAQAHAVLGDEREVRRHARRGDWWQAAALNEPRPVL